MTDRISAAQLAEIERRNSPEHSWNAAGEVSDLIAEVRSGWEVLRDYVAFTDEFFQAHAFGGRELNRSELRDLARRARAFGKGNEDE